MQERPIGRSGISTPALVLGGNVFGWTADKATSFALLDAFVDGGGKMIDTSDFYMARFSGIGGDSERIIGEWLSQRKRRDDVIIVTKVGMLSGVGGEGLKPSRIAAAIDESLARLKTDHVDFYLGHKDDPSVAMADQIEAFDKLVKAGKVRAIGASQYSTARIRVGLAFSATEGLARFELLEPLYNLVERSRFERDIVPLAEAEQLGTIPYYALASGFLTGKYRSPEHLGDDVRSSLAGKYVTSGGLAILAVLDAIAEETRSSPAQIALAWVMHQPGVTAPIASASKMSQLPDLLAAMRLEFSPDQLKRLDDISREFSFSR